MQSEEQLTGRALAEAAARAMGWHLEMGGWFRGDGTFAGNTLSDQGAARGCLTERECLAWLLAKCKAVTADIEAGEVRVCAWWHDREDKAGGSSPESVGSDLLEALQRLVVAVAEREASHG